MTDINPHNRTCALDVLLDAIDALEIVGAPVADDVLITSVTADSRAVVPGSLFVAVPGVAVDGHRFIPQAIAAGARAIVLQNMPADIPEGITLIRVADSRDALGHLASRFYGDPSDELMLVGVTGTNGKTTIATLLYEMARLFGHKAGLLSTVANYINGEEIPADHTTPDPVQLNALLRRMVDAGCTFAAMEVSSHAADQRRIAGLTFAGGIFTNLTRDHLDYHKTFDAYLKAKKSFFDGLLPEAFALTNADDSHGDVMLQNTTARRATYSVRGLADFCVRIVEERLDGMLLSFDGDEVETQFVGRFNASNLAAVYGAAILLRFPREQVLVAMSRLTPVAGRFQPFRSPTGTLAIVDYAHTPDALENVLDTINDLLDGRGRIITVCGCGGNRDHGKRPQMGRIAAEKSDVAILTSDNPRNEDPDEIIEQMAEGINPCYMHKVSKIVDRREAIRHAAAIAKPEDVILIAGKGHETYQIIGNETHHFDDREEINNAFGIQN